VSNSRAVAGIYSSGKGGCIIKIGWVSLFPDVRIVDAPQGAGPESILATVVMDSGFALTRAPE
jgi:hypothetical protein